MKFLYFCFLFSIVQISFAQSSTLFEDSFSERTTDQEKFSIYLDSIDKYLYRDIQITELALAECQKILDKNNPLSDSLLLSFAIQKIFYNHNMANPLEAYRIITNWENTFEKKSVSEHQERSFNYIKGFTYMAIGDLEAAQKTYYENLKKAEAKKDTKTMIRNIYSLGQLYNDEGDYEAAVESFIRILDYADTVYVRPSSLTLFYSELAESYVELGQKKQALASLEEAYKISEENNLQVLRSVILLQKGNLYLAEKDLAAAKKIHAQVQKSNEAAQDEFIISDTKKFLTQLYLAEKNYAKALEVNNDLLVTTDSTNIAQIMGALKNAHEISKEIQDFTAAYDYLLAFNAMKEKKEEDARKQKTSYLKIKFDSEQKEKENAILASKVLQNQTESKLLYLWLAFLGLTLIVLFGAFYQKGRYSKKLETEVFKRTMNLSNSNKLLNKSNGELKEFNRILSHDLKEPLRSIIGFSQLADRANLKNAKVKEYLNYVIGSAKQLEELIKKIHLFQKPDLNKKNEMEEINIQSFLNDTLQEVQDKYPEKLIQLSHNTTPDIFHSFEKLKTIFQVLTDNAANYNENKIVTIHIHYYFKNKNHFFEITDNGIGISKNYHGQIFKMFRRLNNREAYQGSGMGLSIAQKLVQGMGGEIKVLDSKKQQGSTFQIHFPESKAVLVS